LDNLEKVSTATVTVYNYSVFPIDNWAFLLFTVIKIASLLTLIQNHTSLKIYQVIKHFWKIVAFCLVF